MLRTLCPGYPFDRIRDKEVDVLLEYQEHRGSGKDLLNLVVVGHVDAGKSTLMGHLLYLQVGVASLYLTGTCCSHTDNPST